MNLVCNIPDWLYRKWEISKFTLDEAIQLVNCIMDGTPLPKHHGELLILDKNLMKQHLVPFDCSNNLWLNEVGIALSTIKTIPATERR